MDDKRIHEEITQLLYKIEEQYGRIIHFKGSIPLIEVDLALKDVRDLYESLLDLRTMEDIKRRRAFSENKEKAREQKETESFHKPEVKEESIPVSELKEDKSSIKTEAKAEEPTSEKSSDELIEAKASDEINAVEEDDAKLDESSQAAPAEKAEVKEEDKSEKAETPVSKEEKPIAEPKKDLLQERQQNFVPTVRKIEFKPQPVSEEPKKESIFEKAASLYDKIAKPTEKTVASQANKQPISNIKAAIGINEKFGYLKDLFKNNVNEYNSALDKLNNFDSYEEAEDYFQELKGKYDWNPESKSFQGLAELLNRRYLHNG